MDDKSRRPFVREGGERFGADGKPGLRTTDKRASTVRGWQAAFDGLQAGLRAQTGLTCECATPRACRGVAKPRARARMARKNPKRSPVYRGRKRRALVGGGVRSLGQEVRMVGRASQVGASLGFGCSDGAAGGAGCETSAKGAKRDRNREGGESLDISGGVVPRGSFVRSCCLPLWGTRTNERTGRRWWFWWFGTNDRERPGTTESAFTAWPRARMGAPRRKDPSLVRPAVAFQSSRPSSQLQGL